MIQELSRLLFADRGLKVALAAAGAMLVLVSGDEHARRRAIGLAMTLGAHWCP
jgi:hypothetical protein